MHRRAACIASFAFFLRPTTAEFTQPNPFGPVPPVHLEQRSLQPSSCTNDTITVYTADGHFSPGWLSGSRGSEIELTTDLGLSAFVAPFSELSFRSSVPFCDKALLDMVMQGNVLSRASVVLYSSRDGMVSLPTPLWSASPDAVVGKETLGGTLRVVSVEQDMFRVSVNLGAVTKRREASMGKSGTGALHQQTWDTILIRDDSGRGFGVLLESARILPDQPVPGIKDGSSLACVGSVCNEGLAEGKDSKLVPLFGYVPGRDIVEEVVQDDNSERGPESPPTTEKTTTTQVRAGFRVNSRLPDEGFSRGELRELCEVVEATSLGACLLDEIDALFIEQNPTADVHWPVVSIEADSFDALTSIRALMYGKVRWMEVNELAEATSGMEEWASGELGPVNCSGMPWGLDRIQRQEVPDSITGKGIRVYVLDTGVTPHSEFGSRLREGFNCLTGHCSPGATEDDTGHGTHVAGIIAGRCYGVAPGAEIVPIKVLRDSASGGYDAVIAGLKQSVYDLQRLDSQMNIYSDALGDDQSKNRGVINMSLGGPRSSALNDAVKRAVGLGVTVITSAGNDGFSNACTLSPSSATAAVCVSATNSGDHAASFSNVGSCVDIWAPGRDIVSANYENNQGFSIKSGTSQAAPHVTGTAALLLQEAPHLNPRQVAGIIYDTADLLDLAPETTGRFLNLGGLVAALSGLQDGNVEDPAFGR